MNSPHLSIPQTSESAATTVARIPNPTHSIYVALDTFQTPKGSKSLKATTVTSIASVLPSILLTIDILQSPQGSQGPKATTVTRKATPTPTISVTALHFTRESIFSHVVDDRNVFPHFKKTNNRLTFLMTNFFDGQQSVLMLISLMAFSFSPQHQDFGCRSLGCDSLT